MPEQQDLEFLRALRSAQQHHELKQPAHSQIEKRPAHAQPPESGKREATDLRGSRGSPGTNRISEPHAVRPRLRACWVSQLPVGFAVQPARWTRRLPTSRKNSTQRR